MDLRKHRRAEVKCTVSFTREDGVSAEGTVYNLSTGGCAIASDVEVPDRTYVSLRITLSDPASPLVVELAKVRWATRREFGAEFLMLQTEKKHLDRFLARQEGAAGPVW